LWQRRLAVERYDWSRLQPELHVTASVGLIVGEAGEDLELVLRRADERLYAAKRSGRNRVSLVAFVSVVASS
jgi:PleD family two-component response regulator